MPFICVNVSVAFHFLDWVHFKHFQTRDAKLFACSHTSLALPLGFRREESGMSQEFCRDVLDPLGVFQKVCAKEVRAHLSCPIDFRHRMMEGVFFFCPPPCGGGPPLISVIFREFLLIS